MISLRRILNSF